MLNCRVKNIDNYLHRKRESLTLITNSIIPNVLTIAGSDSSGGAGIQADIKTFTALKVYGASVITNVTAQNTLGVQDNYPLPCETIAQQLDSVLSDIGINVVKVGMLFSSHIIDLVAERLSYYNLDKIIIDPVMISSSGKALLESNAIDALREHLLPRASVITPNIPEAARLLDISIENIQQDLVASAKQLSEIYGNAILLKGGHLEGRSCIDTLWYQGQYQQFENPRVNTQNTHGTGCTLASAVSAYLARGLALPDAVNNAVSFTHQALEQANRLNVGSGHGPLNHLI
jgi:hydroxymethylpyrimidine/phosphomethylpyrimidine kinase